MTQTNILNQKPVQEFTVEDCEFYIKKYPYGKNISGVKQQLRKLKKEQSEKKDDEPRLDKQIIESQVYIEREKRNITSNQQRRVKTPQNVVINNNIQKNQSTYTVSELYRESDTAKTILSWIVIIASTVIVGTILIFGLKIMFPETHTLNSGTMRCVIYPALLAVGKWIKDKLE